MQTGTSSDVTAMAREMYDELAPGLDGMGVVDAGITASMLEDYCWLSAQVASLRDRIDREGFMVEVERGRDHHLEPVENPAVKSLARMMTQKQGCFVKLRRAINLSPDEVDDLEEFLDS